MSLWPALQRCSTTGPNCSARARLPEPPLINHLGTAMPTLSVVPQALYWMLVLLREGTSGGMRSVCCQLPRGGGHGTHAGCERAQSHQNDEKVFAVSATGLLSSATSATP